MRLNTKKLNEWLAIQGPHAREALSYKSGIGFYTIGRILRCSRNPTKAERMALIQATGLDEDELFFSEEETKQLA